MAKEWTHVKFNGPMSVGTEYQSITRQSWVHWAMKQSWPVIQPDPIVKAINAKILKN